MEAISGHLRSKLRLETVLAILGRLLKGREGAKMGPKGTKMGQVVAKLARSRGPEAPRSTKEGLVKICFCRFGNILMASLAKKLQSKKPKKPNVFRRFYLLWGGAGGGKEGGGDRRGNGGVVLDGGKRGGCFQLIFLILWWWWWWVLVGVGVGRGQGRRANLRG